MRSKKRWHSWLPVSDVCNVDISFSSHFKSLAPTFYVALRVHLLTLPQQVTWLAVVHRRLHSRSFLVFKIALMNVNAERAQPAISGVRLRSWSSWHSGRTVSWALKANSPAGLALYQKLVVNREPAYLQLFTSTDRETSVAFTRCIAWLREQRHVIAEGIVNDDIKSVSLFFSSTKSEMFSIGVMPTLQQRLNWTSKKKGLRRNSLWWWFRWKLQNRLITLVKGDKLTQVDQFTYLGSRVTADAKSDQELVRDIGIAKTVWR